MRRSPSDRDGDVAAHNSAQRVTLISLGVADLERSGAFYKTLGWQPAEELPEVTFFRLKGFMLGLIGKEALAQDQGRPGATLGTGGAMALAQNYASPEDVDAAFAEAAFGRRHRPQTTGEGRVGRLFRLPMPIRTAMSGKSRTTPSGRSTPRDILRNRTAIEPGRLRRSSEASLAPPHCAP